MRFREKLKFFIFGGCFVALGVALTYLTDIKAEDADFGEIKSFDTIWCKYLAIVDNDGNPRMYFAASRESPTFLMRDSEGKTTFVLSGNTKEVPTLMIFGELEKTRTVIGANGIEKRVNETVISTWP